MANAIYSQNRTVTCDDETYNLNIIFSMRDARYTGIYQEAIQASAIVANSCNVDTQNVTVSSEWINNSFITTDITNLNIGYILKKFSILATYKINGDKYFTKTFEITDIDASNFNANALQQIISNTFTIENMITFKAIPISFTIILNYGGNENG